MFRDYDEYRRRYGRSQPQFITDIPSRTPDGRTPDGRGEYGRMRQEIAQAQADAAEWRETAEKWYNTAKQQQSDLKRLENELAAANRQLAARQQMVNNTPVQPTQRPTRPSDDAAWQEKYLRLAAEQENQKKRLEQRYTRETQQNQEKLLRDMLPLADNLERALNHQETQDETGLALIRKAFLATLAEYGVQPLAAEGRPFDPERHEATGVVNTPEAASGTVLAVEQTGYTYHDKLLRPARVLVAA